MEGTCNCGAVKVKIDDDELFSRPRGHICHCINCQKTAGSVLASNLRIEEKKVTITGEDNLSVYKDPDTLSGKTVSRFFCKTCGNPIKSETEAAKANGQVILKMGIFEKVPKPEFETFGYTKKDWVLFMKSTDGKRYTKGLGSQSADYD